MALAKRKEPPAGRADRKPTKRRKSDSKDDRPIPTSKLENSSHQQSVVVAKEQPAFPRGGSSVLTPIERKQIRAKADRDAAREEAGHNDLFSSTKDAGSSSEDSDIDMEDIKNGGTFVKKHSSVNKKRSRTSKAHSDTIPIEGLSYKRLTEGSLILGRISSISTKDLTVALPNNLSGFVSLTEISSQFTTKLEKLLQQTETGGDDPEHEDDEVDLEQHFRVGQPLRVMVSSLTENVNKSSQSKRRIGLSIQPKHVNAGLTSSSLAVECCVQASVVSVEDHGLVVDVGIDGVKGFIPNTAFDHKLNQNEILVGSVFLCKVTSIGSKGRMLKLSTDLSHEGLLKNASSIDSFLPGTLVDVLLTEVTDSGLAGKVMGLLDVTADALHSDLYNDEKDLKTRFEIGKHVKGRLICTFALAESKRVGFSVLPELVQLETGDIQHLPISSIVMKAEVTAVAPGLGVYMSLGNGNIGFAHISRLTDKAVDTLSATSGPYKVGSVHRARVLDFNSLDGIHILSLQQKVLEQPFLRIDDVSIGQVTKGSIEKVLIGENGINGLIVNLAPGISGLVPALHMSDVALLHPEKKFREGLNVTVRVLSVDKSKRQIRLTLKKSLVNSDQKIWLDLQKISQGDSALGTIIKVDPHGALMQFFGSVKGYLPVSEMSEAYIKDATEHFKTGQVLTVYALNVNVEDNRLVLSAREPSKTQEVDLASLEAGSLTTGTVFEKSQSDVLLRLQGSGAIARISTDHISDGSEKKRRSALEKTRVGQTLRDILVLNVQRKGRLVEISNRSSLIKAAEAGELLTKFEDLQEGKTFTGFISNITEAGVFVRFASNITGLISPNNLPLGVEELDDFGMTRLQPITAKVTSVDYRGATPRFWLTMRAETSQDDLNKTPTSKIDNTVIELIDPVDVNLSNLNDLAVGKVTQARITSIKDTQINVELAKGIQGRIDVSEIFDSWESIKDRKHPLKQFNIKQTLPVKVIGAHDTRNHKFLPLTHRSSKHTVFELSARTSIIENKTFHNLSLADMAINSSHLVFVNNVASDYLMVNVTPELRGRIRATDVSDDLSLAADLRHNFPIGSALRARVIHVDIDKKRLDLSARSGESSRSLTLEDVSPGDLLPGKITKISDRSILVQLSSDLVGAVELLDMADDYEEADTTKYEKNAVVRVCVTKVDKPNKKVYLSMRSSKVLSSGMKIRDPEVESVNQLEVNDVKRGFITNVSDKGIFVALGRDITAFVRVTNLSDEFIKEWKDQFQRDQLVEGKVISIDKGSGHIQLSLKKSHILGKYQVPVTFNDLHEGDIVTGKVAKVETFGVFIIVDNSENVRGLCHRSEIAEKRIEDVTSLGLNEGDAVKAKVLKIDREKRRINFGMKASYFTEAGADSSDDSTDSEVESANDSSAISEEGMELDLDGINGIDSDDDSDDDSLHSGTDPDFDEDEADHTTGTAAKSTTRGLSTSGFDWSGTTSGQNPLMISNAYNDDKEDKTEAKLKKKKRKSEIETDKTGDLDRDGPKSVDDFERLLLGEPDSAELWVRYIAFHIDLGDVDQARQTAERSLKSIGHTQEAEKMTIWVALLNLENTFGDEDSLDAVFKRACEFNDAREIYEKLASIYIRSGKEDKADELFQAATKKFTQSMDLWLNYATFLFDVKGDPQRARSLLPRALQALPEFVHFDVTSSFARLEFKTKTGVAEEGRTRFQGLINVYPKRLDLFNVMLDMEMRYGDDEQIRQLFEQVFTRKMKPGTAKKFFNRWLKFEKEKGDQRRIDEVEARAANWVAEYRESRS